MKKYTVVLQMSEDIFTSSEKEAEDIFFNEYAYKFLSEDKFYLRAEENKED